MRVLNSDKKRFVPLAASREGDTLNSRVGNTHLRAGVLTSLSIIMVLTQEVNVMQVKVPVVVMLQICTLLRCVPCC